VLASDSAVTVLVRGAGPVGQRPEVETPADLRLYQTDGPLAFVSLEHFPVALNQGDSQVLSLRRV
jgi:hypothetical protein